MTQSISNRIRLGQEDIARRAYALYEKRGRQPGRDLDDWLEAERQLSNAVTTQDQNGLQAVTELNRNRYIAPAEASLKAPSVQREHPFARNERGSASREEIRRQTVVTAPRQSQRPSTRSR